MAAASALDPKPPDPPETIFKCKGRWTSKKYVIARLNKTSNKTFNDYSPFNVCRFFKSYSPQSNIQFLRNGAVLITLNNEKDFLNLGNIKTFQNIPVVFELHKSLNFSRGVAYVPELLNCTEDEIKAELAQHGVVNVKRLYKKYNNNKKATALLFLTFEKSEIPERVILDFLSIKIKPFEPKPLLCFSCYKYRHTSKYCEINNCGKCGEKTHKTEVCSNPPKCINCQGEHPAFDTKCPIYEREKKIEKIRANEKVTYRQAEEVIRRQEPVLNTNLTRTLAEVVASATPASTQAPQVPLGAASPQQALTEALINQISQLTNTVEVLLNKIQILESSLNKSDRSKHDNSHKSIDNSQTISSQKNTNIQKVTHETTNDDNNVKQNIVSNTLNQIENKNSNNEQKLRSKIERKQNISNSPIKISNSPDVDVNLKRNRPISQNSSFSEGTYSKNKYNPSTKQKCKVGKIS